MKFPTRIALSFIGLAGVTLPALATTYLPVADGQLLTHATAVVEARVISVESAPPREGWPATDTMIEVQRVVAGEISGRNVLVRLPGGTRPDGSVVELDGIPRFGVGERLFLFLRPGADGTYRVVHLMLGAFRERVVDGRRVLLRNLDGAVSVALPGEPQVERTSGPRDAEAFARWVADAARGERREADYFLDRQEVPGVEQVSGAYRLFESSRGLRMRWFEFDAGQEVDFHIARGGQPGVGEAETAAATRAAIAAWNGAQGSNIRYRYAGSTSSTWLNVIEFDNAGDAIDENFSCTTGGVLAVGGPSYYPNRPAEPGPNGLTYHRITGAGVTLNKNIQCFLERTPNGLAQLLAHELGHTLGIHHPCGGEGGKSCDIAQPLERDALMYPFIHRDNRGARINDDDRAAARALYPGGTSGGPAPTAPSQLSATALSATEVELTWQDNSHDETQFRIQAKAGTGPWLQVATTGADTTGTVVSGLAPATLHSFRVQARRGTSGSAFSAEATATTLPAAPVTPGAFTAATLSDRVTLTWVDESTDETGFLVEVRTPSTEGWNEIAATPADQTELALDGLPSGVPHSFRIRAVGASASSAPSPVVSATPQAPDAACGGDSGALCLQQRFRVTTDWRNPHGVGFGSGTGAAFDGDQSGTFWFFSPDNVELIVKVLDGDALNGHFWVFHGALTDVEYWISVLDTATGRSRTYYNPPFDRCGQFDTTGIPAEPPSSGAGSEIFANPPVAATATASCGDEGTLCLLGGRFEVEVDWVNQHAGDATGFGRPVVGSDETGYFWFFDPTNVELVVKVLDARTVNDRFWVFFGSLSDVEYSLTVRDTETLEVRNYGNSPGSQCGQFDTDAFPIATGGLVAH